MKTQPIFSLSFEVDLYYLYSEEMEEFRSYGGNWVAKICDAVSFHTKRTAEAYRSDLRCNGDIRVVTQDEAKIIELINE
jgi:hypothetical protein